MRFLGMVCLSVFISGASVSAAQSPAEAAFETAVSRAAASSKAGAVLDVQGCGVSFLEARGVANRKTKAPMPADEQLRIASISKLYTAAIIHQLADEGKLNLDAPATRYLTDDTLKCVPNVATASLRQMLNHSSGIPDYYDARSYLFTDWKNPVTAKFALKVAKRRNPTNAPGEGYAYSNTNYQILALVAEQVTGQSFKALTENNLLAPLGLSDTRYNIAHPGGTIHGYGTYLRKRADTWIYAENTGADGGITATAADLRKFLGALFLEDGKLSDIGAELLSSQVQAESPRRIDGAGAEIFLGGDGLQLIGHTGDTMGYLSFAFAVPDYQATIIGHVSANKKDVLFSFLQETVGILRETCGPQTE